MNPRLRGLYFITPDCAEGRRELVAAVLLGGARIVQYRAKSTPPESRLHEARALQDLCHAAGALYLINDDVALCASLRADGVHLGEDDADLAEARRRLGPDKIIGASCYNALESARRAVAAGADYVAFGAVHPSPTKPQARRADLELLRAARRELPVPICAIGGITAENAAPVIAAGVDMVAVIQGIAAAPDPEAAARSLQALFAAPAFDQG
jgi:thiamine-phosphate pyrophosphorylase